MNVHGVKKNKVTFVMMTILLMLVFAIGFCGINAGSDNVAFALDGWNGTAATAFADGDGSEERPYQIATADELALLAAVINTADGETGAKYPGTDYVISAMRTAHYKLTANIVLNNETFTFDPDTGLVEVTDGVNTAYLGTGINGDESGENETFDATGSTMGSWYDSTKTLLTDQPIAANGVVTVEGMTINEWTPIGIFVVGITDLPFKGVFTVTDTP